MSGLLHRLTERTLNVSESRVRPLAPNPWLTAPESPPAAGESVPRIPTLGVLSGLPGQSRAEPPAVQEPPRTGIPDDPADAVARSPDVAEPSAQPRAGETFHREQVETPGALALSVESLSSPSVAPPTGPLLSSDIRPDTDAPRPSTLVATPRSGREDRPRPPARLLAELPDTPMASVDRNRPYEATETSQPATEVHVRIARVELTAVMEPPAPQGKSRPAPAGPSLDEYLQQRKERLG
jgi:hypothetical protein